MDEETLLEMSFAEKVLLIKKITEEIITDADRKYRKISDLFVFTKDPKDVDIVHKAIQSLCEVYIEIIPAYRIREDQSKDTVDDATGQQKGMKLSKEVKQLRDYESFLVQTYKEYLEMLEKLSEIKPAAFASRVQDADQKTKMLQVYTKLRSLSVGCFCSLLKKHPHFNFRVNILQTVMPHLGSKEKELRKQATDTLFAILSDTDQTQLDFKVDTLRELSKVLQSKSHQHMEPNLLDCLVLHLIIVDEQKAQAMQQSTQKTQQLHDQMNKLRRKGKLKDYKEMKQELLAEVKQADAVGVDLGKAGTYNNDIIKEILSIYFSVLKGGGGGASKQINRSSPLLKSVFLGIPQFTQFINLEIVFDLVNVLREFLQLELDRSTKATKSSIGNALTALLCVFQIIEVGAGTAFNVDEKDFVDGLYAVIQRMYEQPLDYQLPEFLAFLKCAHLVFVIKRQY